MRQSDAQFRQDFRQTQLLANENRALPSLDQGIGGGATLPTLFTPVVPGVTPQAVNQLRNGDLGFSVWGWFETTLPVTNADEDEECAWFYSNTIPVNGQEIVLINNFTDPATPNVTLKSPAHSDYDPNFCDWDPTDGVARLNGTYTIDAPWPSNITGPGKTVYIVFIAAKRNQYISLPSPFRIYCGVWDNTAGQRDWIQAGAAFTLSGSTIGTPSSTTERRYKIHARTDRGYSFLSDELTLANSPADGAFEPDFVYNSLNWTRLPNNQGILSYDIYRYDVVANQYWLLEEATNGSQNYADQNTFLREVSGYPTATYDRGIAYVATTSGNLNNLAVDGVSAAWDTLIVPVQVPPNYNQGNTSAASSNQILRIGQTRAADVYLTDVVTINGSPTITSAAAQFVVEMEGLSGTLTYNDTSVDVKLDTYVSATNFTLQSNVTFDATDATLLIEGGGFHGVLIDLIHASFQSGATFSPNAEDLNRTLQPRAAPDGSSQGGTGIGGSGNEGGGDGGIRCLAEGIPVMTRGRYGVTRTLVENLFKNLPVESELFNTPNYISTNNRYWCDNIWRVETDQWAIECSPQHLLTTSQTDQRGVQVQLLKPGDFTLTETNGFIGREKLIICEATGRGGYVRQPSLYPRHVYIAGKAKRSFWQKLFRKTVLGGFLQHNVKPLQEPTQNQS